jgi:hypothetical protein
MHIPTCIVKNKNTTVTPCRIPVLSTLNSANLHKFCVESNFTKKKTKNAFILTVMSELCSPSLKYSNWFIVSIQCLLKA